MPLRRRLRNLRSLLWRCSWQQLVLVGSKIWTRGHECWTLLDIEIPLNSFNIFLHQGTDIPYSWQNSPQKILKASSVFSGPGHVEQLRLRICGTRGFASYNWVGGRVFAAKMVWRFEFEADPSQKLGQSFSPFPNLFLLFSTGHLRDEIVIWTTFEDHKHWVIFKHFLPAAMPYNSKRFSHVGYSNN